MRERSFIDAIDNQEVTEGRAAQERLPNTIQEKLLNAIQERLLGGYLKLLPFGGLWTQRSDCSHEQSRIVLPCKVLVSLKFFRANK